MRRGSNGANVPADRHARVSGVLEMAALDDLGPLTRRAICESPLPTLACTIVSQIIELNDKIEAENKLRAERDMPQRAYVDPKHPDLDRRLAAGVFQNNYMIILNDPELEHAEDHARMGIKPLVPKLSAKTARERRRTEGRRFRGW